MTPKRQGSGRTGGQVLIFLGLLCLGIAIAKPRLEAGARDRRIDAVQTTVDVVRTSMERYASERGDYPPDTPSGQEPAELTPYLDGAVEFSTVDYRVDVDRWESVDEQAIVANPDLRDTTTRPAASIRASGGVTIHSQESMLLAALYEGYGPSVSFVRDTSWTLVLPGVAPTP